MMDVADKARLTDSLYCYEMTVPSYFTSDQSKSVALQDVCWALNLSVNLEKRRITCFELRASDPSKIAAKSASPQVIRVDKGISGITLINQPIAKLVEIIEDDPLNGPVVDGTDLKGHIDILLEYDRRLSNCILSKSSCMIFSLRLATSFETRFTREDLPQRHGETNVVLIPFRKLSLSLFISLTQLENPSVLTLLPKRNGDFLRQIWQLNSIQVDSMKITGNLPLGKLQNSRPAIL